MIKYYVDDHPEITYSELDSKLSRNLQGNLGTFTTIERANEIYNKKGHKRHFIKPEELIKLADCVIAVSNQWGIGNIGGFIEQAKLLGYEIESVN